MMQVVEMTDEEQMAMYMKLPKKQIIEMLINCNKILSHQSICYHPILFRDYFNDTNYTCTNCGKVAY